MCGREVLLYMVSQSGVEPPTFPLGGGCSIQLSYWDIFMGMVAVQPRPVRMLASIRAFVMPPWPATETGKNVHSGINGPWFCSMARISHTHCWRNGSARNTICHHIDAKLPTST